MGSLAILLSLPLARGAAPVMWAKQRPLLKIIIVRIVALEVFELLFGNMETVCGVLTPLLPIRDLRLFFYKRFNADKCMALSLFLFFFLFWVGHPTNKWVPTRRLAVKRGAWPR